MLLIISYELNIILIYLAIYLTTKPAFTLGFSIRVSCFVVLFCFHGLYRGKKILPFKLFELDAKMIAIKELTKGVLSESGYILIFLSVRMLIHQWLQRQITFTYVFHSRNKLAEPRARKSFYNVIAKVKEPTGLAAGVKSVLNLWGNAIHYSQLSYKLGALWGCLFFSSRLPKCSCKYLFT